MTRYIHMHERFSAPATASVLLGVLSGNAHRRRILRCAFARMRAALPLTLYQEDLNGPVRLLFVVGTTAGEEQPRAADVLAVPVPEHGVTGAFSTVGTTAALRKAGYLLRHALRTDARMLAIADDVRESHACTVERQQRLRRCVALGSCPGRTPLSRSRP